MQKALTINEQVKVVAKFEDEDQGGFFCQPIKMDFRGHEVKFSNFRINYTNMADSEKRVFDLFDQEKRYRLIFNIDNLSWLLASVAGR